MSFLPRLRAIKATPVLSPLQTPLTTASGIIAASPLVLIDLETDSGFTGRAYLFVYTPPALGPIVQMLASLSTELVGAVVTPEGLVQTLGARFRLLGTAGLLGMAIAGLEMAAWDVLAQTAGMPLYQVLGGQPKPIRAYASLGLDGIELGQHRVTAALRQGFRAVKIKLGYPTLEEDLRVVRAMREVLGSGPDLMVDYNQSLSVPEAIRRCVALDELGLTWIEEPTLQEDYAGHAEIAAQITTPIQIGENWFGLAEMTKALDAHASDLAMPDLMKIGGVSAWRGAATLAQSRGVPISTHLFHEISAHLMTIAPTADYLEVMDLAAPVLSEPMAFENGFAVLPVRAGNGLVWDAAAVKRYQVI